MLRQSSSCPSCGNSVSWFTSSVAITCNNCDTLLAISGNTLTAKGKTAPAPDDKTLLRIGAKGKMAGRNYEVAGRFRYQFQNGIENQWYLVYEDGKFAWLSETYGEFYLMVLTDIEVQQATINNAKPGMGFKKEEFSGYKIVSIKQCQGGTMEGESPEFPELNKKFKTVEFENADGLVLAIVSYGPAETDVYQGTWMSLDQLGLYDKPAVLADFERSDVPSVSCPSCGKPFLQITGGQAIDGVCPHCVTTFDILWGVPKKRSELKDDSGWKPVFAPGTKLVFDKISWKVTGACIKRDHEGYTWREYVLFHPEHGYNFLSEFNGHWILFTSMGPLIDASDSAPVYDGESFALFQRYTFTVYYAIGEFPYKLFPKEKTKVSEYISPPRVLSVEKSDSEWSWGLGRHVSADEIKAAGKAETALPEVTGIGMVQPGKIAPKEKALIRKLTLYGLAILVFMFIYFQFTAESKTIFYRSYGMSDSDWGKPVVTDSFIVDGGTGNLQVSLYSPVSNNWMEADIALVSESTGDMYWFLKGVEYYSGKDSDGPWTEGSQTNEQMISMVPEGLYRLIITPHKAITNTGLTMFSVDVKRDVPLYINMIFAVLLLSVFPIIVETRARSMEVNRWMNSNYSPYASDDE